MKKILTILFCLVSAVGFSQINPSLGTTSNKSYSPAQAVPTDFRSMYWDNTNFIARPYQNTTELLSYLNLSKYRSGNVIYVVDSGGTLLPNGTYTGTFVNTFYMFRDGTADANLLKINLFGASSSGGSGTVTAVSATNGSGLTFTITNPNTTPNISIVTAAGGDVSGALNNLTVNKFNGLTPAYYLNYNNLTNLPTIPAQFNPIAGTGITLAGSYPNITISSSGSGFNTAGYGLIALSSSTVAIDSQNYRKVDTLYNPNDSTLIYKLNGVTNTLTLRGGAHGSGGGTGSVTNVSVVPANGVSGSVANPTSTPAITLTLGAITPSTVNGLTLTALTTGFTIAGGTTSKTLTVPLNASVSNTNTGDVTLAGETYITIAGQIITANAVNLSGTNVTGLLKAASFPALTGDVTNSGGSLATTIAANAVTLGKMATMSAGLIGNASGTATPSVILLGYGMTFSGGKLAVDSANLKDSIYTVMGVKYYGTTNDSIGIGGPFYQSASISLRNLYGFTIDSAQAGSSKGFRANFGSDAGYDLFYRDSATGYWTRLPKGTPGQYLHMAYTGGFDWAAASGGGGSSFSRQSITSGSSGTVTGGNYIVKFNPSSAIASYALTLPASPADKDIVKIEFGGTITVGTVVTYLQIFPNSGQSLIDNTPPNSATADNYLEYQYDGTLNIWYRRKF